MGRSLAIAISGGGIAGITAAIAIARSGHTVTVYEASRSIRTAGAGIQVAPNMSRILDRLGLKDLTADHASPQTSVIHHRWEDGKQIGILRLDEIARRSGSPYVTIHRGQLLDKLYLVAKKLGVEFVFEAKVTDYDLETPSISTESGVHVTPDMLVVADGINSRARECFEQTAIEPGLSAKYTAYRAVIPATQVKSCPEIAWLVEPTLQHLWNGPERHIIAYMIENNTLLNLAFVIPSQESSSRSPLEEVRQGFEGWESSIRILLGMITEASRWPIWVAPHLVNFVSDSDLSVVIGDAAHDVTPFMAQGGAMSVEDGAVLGKVLADVSDINDIPAALLKYESLRMPRTRQLAFDCVANLHLFQLSDGEAQRQRDEKAIKNQKDSTAESPYLWANEAGRQWIYGFDAESDDPSTHPHVIREKNKRRAIHRESGGCPS